jgi:thymidine phosphorylase
VLNAAYRVRVVDLATGLDAVVLDRVRDGFGPAMQVAASVRALADRIVAVAREAFYGGYQTAVFVAAALLLVTAVIAVVAGPRRS